MERVNIKGEKVEYETGQIIWGDTGTNCQHASTQLIMQGTKRVPVDFIGFREPLHDIGEHHRILMANMVAQAEAMGFGNKDLDNMHKNIEGDVPVNTIIGTKLTPSVLGQIIALYEHITYVQGVVWEINSFDQYGVELGKKLAKNVVEELDDKGKNLRHDSSTNNLIEKLRYII